MKNCEGGCLRGTTNSVCPKLSDLKPDLPPVFPESLGTLIYFVSQIRTRLKAGTMLTCLCVPMA